ncbi:hypothetical protein KIPB_009588 [Kipferlia bialata]|uniref:Uncharacterized protein n=1 Tax=Kipferlia bialata TaxID=797122 RepID=A0A9K3D212_9EUKA|nr:hypothetical protein KIPB_009588 [Kipferlia bialata]|eukprot:g9588.t1
MHSQCLLLLAVCLGVCVHSVRGDVSPYRSIPSHPLILVPGLGCSSLMTYEQETEAWLADDDTTRHDMLGSLLESGRYESFSNDALVLTPPSAKDSDDTLDDVSDITGDAYPYEAEPQCMEGLIAHLERYE